MPVKKDPELRLFQVITPKVVVAQLSALATMQGISKMRLAGELLAQAVSLLWDETFELEGEPLRERPSAFDSDPKLWKKKEVRKK